MNLFDLVAKITLDTSEYEKGLKDAPGLLTKAGGKLAKVGGVAMAAASTAVVAFGKASIDAGKKFDSSMSQVAATMGLTMSELEQKTGSVSTAYGEFTGNLREYAQFMGKNTAFSASQAADALNYMALAGYDAQTSMNMLPNVLNLAAAGGMDLARASDMITDTQTALGLSTEDTTKLVDKMAKTASKSNTSVEQLGDAMLTVGGTAKMMKGGTTELSAALGILADNGVKGAEGGTALRNVLLGVQSKKFDKTFGALGVSAYDAEGNMRPLNETLADMNKAMEGMTTQEKNKLITNAFNKADLKNVNALLATSTERWEELTGEIDDATGAAQQMADTQLDNLAGDMTLFQSALEGAQIAISDALTPTLRGLVQEGTSGLQRLTDAFTEGGFEKAIDVAADLIAEWTQKLVEGIPKVLAIGAKLLIALGKGIIMAIPSVVKGLGKLGGQLIDAIRRGMAKGVGKLANGFVKDLKSKSDTMRDGALALIDSIGDQAKRFIELGKMLILNLVDGLTAALPTIIKNGAEVVKKFVSGFINGIPDAITSIGVLGYSIINMIMTFIPNMWQAGMDIMKSIGEGLEKNKKSITISIKAAIASILSALRNGLPNLLSTGAEMIKFLANGAASAFSFITSVVGEVITYIGTWITNNADDLIDKGFELFNNVVTGIGNAIADIGTTLGGILESILSWINGDGASGLSEKGGEIWDKIKDGFVNALENIGEALMGILSGITTWVTTHWGDISQAGKNILTYIVEGIVAVASDVVTGMLSLLKEIGTWLVQNYQSIFNVGKTIIEYIIEGIVEFVKTIGKGFVDFIKNVGQWFTDNSGDITNFGHDVIDWIKDGIKEWISHIKDGFADLPMKIQEKINNVGAFLLSIGRLILQKIINGIKEWMSHIADWVKDVPGKIKEKIQEFVNDLKGAGKAIIDGIKDGITDNGLTSKLRGVVQGAINAVKKLIPNWLKNTNWEAEANKVGGAGDVGNGVIYAKAQFQPYMFNKATIFGRYRDQNLIAGEAEPEMLLGVRTLRNMMYESVQAGTTAMAGQIVDAVGNRQDGGSAALQREIINVLNAYLPMLASQQVVLDSGALVGAIAPGIDSTLGNTAGNKRRYAAS